jgi:small subunit ribosomal protein S7
MVTMQVEMHFNKIFDKWEIADVTIADVGLEQHISLKPLSALHTGGRHAKQQFEESKVCIVELLINKLMRSEKNTGKKMKSYAIVRDAFDIIHESTGANPLQVLVDAIQNTGPREETIRLRFGGILVPKAVDVSSQRRVDEALRFITQGAQKCAFKNKRSIARCLADELIAASKNAKCFSINKKEEKERIARAAR